MTGINASKIIQNLEILHSFAPVNLTSERCAGFERRGNRENGKERNPKKSDFWDFSFFKIGSGANPLHPAARGGWLAKESLSPLQYGTRIRDWVPLSAAIAIPVHGKCELGRVLINRRRRSMSA